MIFLHIKRCGCITLTWIDIENGHPKWHYGCCKCCPQGTISRFETRLRRRNGLWDGWVSWQFHRLFEWVTMFQVDWWNIAIDAIVACHFPTANPGSVCPPLAWKCEPSRWGENWTLWKYWIGEMWICNNPPNCWPCREMIGWPWHQRKYSRNCVVWILRQSAFPAMKSGCEQWWKMPVEFAFPHGRPNEM